MAHGYALHRISHRLWLLHHLVCLLYVDGIVDVELEVAHQCQMVPQLVLEVVVVACTRHHTLHHTHDGRGTALSLGTCGQSHTVVYHLLYLASILGQHKALALGVIIESFYIHTFLFLCYGVRGRLYAQPAVHGGATAASSTPLQRSP